MKYSEMSEENLKKELESLKKEYESVKAKGLRLDMSRGKPSPAQLDITNDLLDTINSKTGCVSESGIDCRNYGNLEGIPEARKLMGEFMGVPADNVFVCGNASLNIMYDCIAGAMLFGIMGSTPWCKLDKVKFLCPVPGYDRHFKITELMGIEMINVPMTESGPDMDIVEKLVSSDSSIKGIWCVPKYSNPQGIVYSDETVRRFAALKPAAKDFRIFWDNAYALHYIYDENIEIPEILSECEKAGNPNLVYEFCSTSKISFAGGGISAIAASKDNLDWIRNRLTVQTISYDKINQLRHVLYFKNGEGLKSHMKKHADFLRPKFDAVLDIFERELGGLGIGTWMKPMGGYFISFESMEGCAKAIVAKCKDAGVVLTGAGAPFPYGVDPKDSTIRIAPSYPSLSELTMAAELFTLCVKIASLEKLLEK
ncbi:MAG: aminotransferase class I/II-fold pyridoxal phosphate-dependent enzyme [Butyrivibrio sp.]